MRRLVTLGVSSLLVGLAFTACGDDEGNGPSAGAGGSAGRGGSGAGGGNMGGRGGSGGATGGQGGSGGGTAATPPAANCTGCVQLSVSIPATPVRPPMGADTTGYSQAGYGFGAPGAPTVTPPFDLSAVTSITYKIQVLTPDASFYVQPVLQNGPPEDPMYQFGYYGAARTALTAAAFPAGTFVDVPLDVSAIPAVGGGGDAGVAPEADAGGDDAGAAPVDVLTAFDKSKVRQIALNVGILGNTTQTGFVSIEIDSVTVAGTSNFTTKEFATDVEGLTLNNYEVPNGTATLAPVHH
jgi:hypothetical protein